MEAGPPEPGGASDGHGQSTVYPTSEQIVVQGRAGIQLVSPSTAT